jgi:hypothetical protein
MTPNPPSIPTCTWKRPIGQPWENPYVVRYPSNLDDGPEHGMPLGGFGAGCIGRSHNIFFRTLRVVSSAYLSKPSRAAKPMPSPPLGQKTVASRLGDGIRLRMAATTKRCIPAVGITIAMS